MELGRCVSRCVYVRAQFSVPSRVQHARTFLGPKSNFKDPWYVLFMSMSFLKGAFFTETVYTGHGYKAAFSMVSAENDAQKIFILRAQSSLFSCGSQQARQLQKCTATHKINARTGSTPCGRSVVAAESHDCFHGSKFPMFSRGVGSFIHCKT